MNRIPTIMLAAITALTFTFPASLFATTPENTLVLGVFPYISASQMIEQLSPLCKRIEEALDKKVIMVSATDFMSYVRSTAKGEYDLTLTAPHMGRLAEKRDGWLRVAQSSQKTATVLLVRQESPIKGLEDFPGKKLAVGNWRSVTYLLAEEALAQKGISLNKDLEVIETATFSNVVQSVFLGEADIGATPTLLWDKWQYINAEQHRQLREILRTKAGTPSFLVMARPGTTQEVINRLKASLLSFHETEEGKVFFEKSQFGSFIPLDDSTMESIDPYVHVLLEPQP